MWSILSFISMILMITQRCIITQSTKPNFVIFNIDDILWTSSMSKSAPKGLKLNGKTINYEDISTPNIQNIIDSSVTFSRCYANPKCTPSRYSLLTGRYAVRSEYGKQKALKTTGEQGTMVSVTTSKLLYNDNIYNIPNMLKTIGNYKTGMVGKWHLMTSNDNNYNYGCKALMNIQNKTLYNLCTNIVKEAGFDFVDGFYADNINPNIYFSHNPEWMLYESQKFISNAINNKQAFFLYFSSTLTHGPSAMDAMLEYGIDDTPKGKLYGDDIPNKTGMDNRDNIWNKVQNNGIRGVSDNTLLSYLWLDESIGALLQYLIDNKIYDDTFFVLTNDHGMGTKGFLYEHGSRIMQYVRYPKLFGYNGHVLDDNFIVNNVDLAATIFNVAGIMDKIPNQYIMDSTNWLYDVIDIINNTNNNNNEDIGCCKYRHIDMYNSHAIISAKYKYIFRGTSEMENTKTYYKYATDIEQLYDIEQDIDEQNNIINNDNMKDIVYQFRIKMIDYIKTSVCYIDNRDNCIVPKLTYIPTDSQRITTTAPISTDSTSDDNDIFTCQQVINWDNTWKRVTSWNEDDDEDDYLYEAVNKFVNKKKYSICGDVTNLEFLYHFIYSTDEQTLDIYLIICCGFGTQFGDEYVIPDGYKRNDKYLEAAYIDSDDDDGGDSDDNWFTFKYILIAIIILLICICCICAGFIYKKFRKNEKEKVHENKDNIIIMTNMSQIRVDDIENSDTKDTPFEQGDEELNQMTYDYEIDI